jgi:hypothetical protein
VAIDHEFYAGTETKWGWSEEATFGTAIADAGAFEQLEGPPPTGIDYGITVDRSVKYDGSRMRADANVWHSESGGLRVIPFSDLIVRRNDLGVLLYSVMQVMDEGEATAFAKTLTLDKNTTQPDFSNNAGLFLTIGIYDPIASNHRKFTSCVLRTLTLTWNPLEGDGRLRASGEFISGFANDTTANLSGTWAFNAQNYWECNWSTAQLASNDIVPYGFSITINNGLVRAGRNSSGNASGYVPAAGGDGYDVQGTLIMKYDQYTDGLIADHVAGTLRKIQLAVGTPGAAGHFDLTVYEADLDASGREYDRPEGQAISLPFFAVTDGAVSDVGLLATVEDGNDRAWPT